jgi:hemerythrin HHE cation binding domain-containing protein
MTKKPVDEPRRMLIAATGVVIASGLIPSLAVRRSYGEENGMTEESEHGGSEEGEEEVTPPEDLMREHGVLDRVLLIYESALKRFASNEDFDPAVLTDSAKIVREFIEDYHEKQEEDYVFPRFKQAGKMVRLVDILLEQHQAGRRVTDVILKFVPTSRRTGTIAASSSAA